MSRIRKTYSAELKTKLVYTTPEKSNNISRILIPKMIK